jgi:L-alanine-DL-glutamate epimerase-like enolase superfamily enzyme
MESSPLVITRIETFIYRAAVSKPVVSSLATISSRVALLVRVEDASGAFGWGEVYATLPSHGAEHRAQYLHRNIAPLVLGKPITDIAALWRSLSIKTHGMAIQTGEPGPIAAALAGLDTAIWDLQARRQGKPLCGLLGADPGPLPCYASGLNPADGPEVVRQSRAAGFRAFKQKIGFDDATDLANLAAIRQDMAAGEKLMVDVNQGWTLEQALAKAPGLAAFDLTWVEEPLQADRPAQEWQQCARACASPLAGGENLRGDDFDKHAAWLGFVQPDVGKWGGVSGNLMVARAALAAGKIYCPHWLGAGIGLMASAHVLLAAGGPGMLEVDVNENPLRELLAQPFPSLRDGNLQIAAQPGIGVLPGIEQSARWLVGHEQSTL